CEPSGSAEPGLIALQMAHRLVALCVLAVLGTIAYRLARMRRNRIAVGPRVWWSAAAVGLTLLQAAIGVVAVTSGLPWITQVLHVAGAAGVWTATVGLAANTGVGREQASLRRVEL